jgi:hypothetical protein
VVASKTDTGTDHTLQVNKNLISFGNYVDIQFELPHGTVEDGNAFIRDPLRLVETLWDSGNYQRFNDTTEHKFQLQCSVIKFPILGTYRPEIELNVFTIDRGQGFKTSNLRVKKEGDQLRDSNALDLIQVDFRGELHVASVNDAQTPVVKGFVEYKVHGVKPR